MTDAFAEFGLEKRPWLDPLAVQVRYHELAVPRHPDKCGQDPLPLARLNEARGILSSHASRLRHLLTLVLPTEAPQSRFQPDFDLFSFVGTLSRKAETLSAKRDRASSGLTKALAKTETEALEKEVVAAIDRLNLLACTLEKKIQLLDARWPSVTAEEIVLLAEEDTFYQKWRQSLRDARTRLLGG
ncbi:MAG: hypothetical protein ACOYM3_03730 [Terrimicrobiaceae bacterium]